MGGRRTRRPSSAEGEGSDLTPNLVASGKYLLSRMLNPKTWHAGLL